MTPNAGAAGYRQAAFVHGLGGSACNWTDLMYLLELVAGGIAPDLLGFGQSPVPRDGQTKILYDFRLSGAARFDSGLCFPITSL